MLLNSQGKIIKGTEAAEEINDHFCKVGFDLAQQVPPSN